MQDIEKDIECAMKAVEEENERRREERLANPQPPREDLFDNLESKQSWFEVVTSRAAGFASIVVSIVIIIAVLVLISRIFSRASYDKYDYLDHRAPDDYRISI